MVCSGPEKAPAALKPAAQAYRFLQQQPQIEHWAVLVITPHSWLNLGPSQPLRLFLEPPGVVGDRCRLEGPGAGAECCQQIPASCHARL
ncbi:MAG: hypothetical protein VKL23_04105 [Cyanobacteriota bacterium]|nr:hypothetical protein [Cyanobacteriota bacterium]